MIEVVERERKTIKESISELCDEGGAHRISMSQGLRPRMGGFTATQVGWEVTIGVTIHDGMSELRQKGAGGGYLRHELRTRFGTICQQESINDSELGAMVEFKFKRCYKTPRASHEIKLVHLRFEQLRRAQSVEHRAIFEPQIS